MNVCSCVNNCKQCGACCQMPHLKTCPQYVGIPPELPGLPSLPVSPTPRDPVLSFDTTPLAYIAYERGAARAVGPFMSEAAAQAYAAGHPPDEDWIAVPLRTPDA